MDTLYLFQRAVQALKTFVSDNTALSVYVDVSNYPVKISFYEENKQISFDDTEDREAGDRVSGLQFIFYDKMQIKTQEDFKVSEETFNKLKNLSKEVNRLYLNALFEKFDTFRKSIAKNINDCKGIKKIGNSATSYDGKEFFLAVVMPQEIICRLVESIEVEIE